MVRLAVLIFCLYLLVLGVATAAKASTVAQARAEIVRLWGDQSPRALCIVRRESGWNPRAVSPTNDYGLFQLNAIHARTFGPRWLQVLDPVANVRMAYTLYRSSGWQPWAGGRYPC